MAMNTIKHPVLPIFLVDDESAARASMEILLRTASLGNTMQYADPREVMPALARQRASVILLDLGMPHIPGETLLQQIAAEYPAIPLLARHFLAEFAKEMGMPTPAIAKRLKRSKDEDET